MGTVLRKLLHFFMVCTVCCMVFVSAASIGEWFTLIHTNDILSHFDESASTECDHIGSCMGGVARLVHLVKEEKARGPNVLVVDAGHMLNTKLVNHTSAETLITQLVNKIGYHVVGIGRFELFGGPEKLDTFIAWLQKSGTKVLCSNLQYRIKGKPATRCEKSAVVKVGKLKVGFVAYIKSRAKSLIDEDFDIENVEDFSLITKMNGISELVNDLYKKQNVDIVITIINVKQDIVATVQKQDVPLSDIYIGSYVMDLYWNENIQEAHEPVWEYRPREDGPLGERIIHPYPVPFMKHNRTAYVVSAGRNMLYAGRIRFNVQAKSIRAFNATNPRILTGRKDAEAEKIIASVRQHQMEFLGGRLGITPFTIDGGAPCLEGDCGMGNLVGDSLLHACITPYRVHEDGPVIGWSTVTGALLHGSDLNTIYRGVITAEDILIAFSFSDRYVTFDIKGNDLIEMMKATTTKVLGSSHQVSTDIQISGIRVKFRGQKLTKITNLCSVCSVPKFDVVDPEHTYRLVATEYLYADLRKKGYIKRPNAIFSEKTIQTAVKEFILDHSPILFGREDRIKIAD